MTRGIEIQGCTYASRRAAAAALGVTRQAVECAERRGSLHRIGKGPGRTPEAVQTEDGRTYDSKGQLAAALGISPATLSYRIKRGLIKLKLA